VIEIERTAEFQSEFHKDELVTWHDYQEKKCVPVPGVVVLQDAESVLIRICVEGLLKELRVHPQQLVHR
jgi:hypothetical protein